MLIHNVTYKVDRDVSTAFVNFAERHLIPLILESDTVETYHLTRLLGVDECDGVTYCLLLQFSSRPAFDIYTERFQLKYQKMLDREFSGQFVSFPSILDVVSEGQ